MIISCIVLLVLAAPLVAVLVIVPFTPIEYAIFAIVIGVIILLHTFVHLIECLNAAEYDFACPNCGKRFFVSARKLFGKFNGVYMGVAFHSRICLGLSWLRGIYNTAYLKCPACGKRGFCYIPDRFPPDFEPPSAWRGK